MTEATPASVGDHGDDIDSASRATYFDTNKAHMARVYDYWLGGKDHFAADRAAGDAVIQAYPGVITTVRANRALLVRMVRYLAGEAGIAQFLDIGTGIPSANNTPEMEQSVTPNARVVYTDNDPVVLAHSRALLTSGPAGVTTYLDADLRNPGPILEQAADTLDFSRPLAVMLMGVMHLVGDADDPAGIVASLKRAMPPGSYLALSHPASDIDAAAQGKLAEGLNQTMAEKVTMRDRAQVARFFDGLELVEPGLVRVPEWRPASELEARSPAGLWGGVGRRN